jgi:signal transduction histidine kinase
MSVVEGLIVLNSIIAGVAVALGLFLLSSSGRDTKKVLFAILNITTAVWILANYFGDATTFPLVVIDYTLGVFMGLLFWLFSREMRLGATAKQKPNTLTTSVGIAVALVLAGMVIGGQIIHLDSQSTNLENGIFYLLYPAVIVVFIVSAIYHLIKAKLKSRIKEHRIQLNFVISGLVIAFVSIAVPNLLLENILLKDNELLLLAYDGAYVGILAFLAISTFAIVKHGLFDIKRAAVRSAAYILSIVTLSGVYYVMAYLVSVALFGGQMTSNISLSPINIFLALILAFIFQPVKLFFDRVTNSIFYRDSYNSDDFFATLSDLLTSTVELRVLLERASRQIASTFKAEQAMFFVYYENGRGHHTSAGTPGHARLPVHDAHMLDQFVLADPRRNVYLTEMISNDTTKRMLHSHKIALVMPLRQANRITGYVLLGDRLSGVYTKRDLNVLATVGNELVIAIQNALSIHEVKELNATLQQRIDIATKELRSSNAQLKHLDEVKDEFMSMASHQLRTPLTSVKGYISMVVEGDVGKVSPQQQKLLTEAFKSSERMVRLISDFLDVSRLQTGKFVIEKAPFDLVDVVKQEVRDLELMAHAHELKLRLNVRAKGPMIVNADEQKIRQVIMNYIDNAIFYSSAKSTIIINLEQVKHEAALTVVDTGIGVPEDVQARLFTKFFRAPNARQRRPDGTGIGLYLTRRVLNAHDGSIIFSSKEGKGSTFGFRLPIAKNLKVPAPAPEPVVVAKVKAKTNK